MRRKAEGEGGGGEDHGGLRSFPGWMVLVCDSYEEGMLGVFVSAISRRVDIECYGCSILVWWLGRRGL